MRRGPGSRSPSCAIGHSSSDWTLHWRDRNEKWFAYNDLFSGTAAELLAEIEEDPTCIFWG